jgi:filamentous hemagglutinin family protein
MKRGHWLNNCSQSGFVGILTWLSISVFACKTLAQSSNILPDNTLGAESSQVTPDYEGEAVEVITGGATRGINLFHSFREFNVSEGRGAYFLSPNADIQNILSRVTGSNKSEILGTLGTFGESQPNLFLINPNGIMFGENASLDVQGSFAATTANGVQFGSQGNFSATNPQQPSQLLTINPSAFLFNQINQNAAIENKSFAPAGTDPAGFDAFGLRVPDGKSLLLLGGNVLMDGGELNASGGRVELGGLAEPGNVNLAVNGDNLKLGFPENVTRANILFTNQAAVYVEAAGGGNIAVNAKNLEVLEGSSFSAGMGQGLGTPDSIAGDITLNATGEIKVAGSGSGIGNQVRVGSKGNGGNVSIDSGSFSLQDGAQIGASTSGLGNAGNVTVRAKDNVSLANAVIFKTVEAGGVGKGGNIDISAATLSLTDGAQLITITRGASANQLAGRGDAGNVNLKITGAVDIIGINTAIGSTVLEGTVGNGGNISIDSSSFSLRDDAQIVTSTYGQGNAGNVTVRAKDFVFLTGSRSTIFSTVQATGIGKGGNIDINAASVTLQDNASLVASSYGQGSAGDVIINAKENILFDRSNAFSTVEPGGIGNGGKIAIASENLTLNNGSRLETLVRQGYDNQPAGRGNAGSINVDVRDTVTISGVENDSRSGFRSLADFGTVGNGGSINIKTGSFIASDGAEVIASIFGKGSAGNIFIDARENVQFNGANAYGTIGFQGDGKGGDINIKAGSLFFTNGAEISTATFGIGSAGNVILNARDTVLFDKANVFTSVDVSGRGNAGDIRINTDSLSIINGAILTSNTSGQGSAGNVLIDATKNVFLDNKSAASAIVQKGAVGNGGNININTILLSVTNGSELQTNTSGRGNAGNLIINARDRVSFADASGALSRVEKEGVGKGGDIRINTNSFSVINGAQLTTSTLGQGNAGNIQIQASENVNIAGSSTIDGFSSGLFSTTFASSTGKGGNITIDTNVFRVSNGAFLDARTRNDGRGGDITVNGNLVEALNGGQLLTTTSGSGRAGKITVNASDRVLLNGNDATFNQRLANFPDAVTNKDAGATSGFFVLSTGSAIAGDIEVNSPKVTLDNGGRINAESASGDGGNINLNISNLLLMRRGSQISTSAGTAQQGGDGGNIDINSRFIVAVPEENSDISANAFTGAGGKVQITSRGVFGIEARSQLSDRSDITASSERGVQGVTTINAPDNSGIQNSLNQLSENPIDPNALIANSCIARRNSPQNSTFFITGKGGLPERPGEAPISPFSTGTMQNVPKDGDSTKPRPWKIGDPIVEPTGVYRLANGKRVLSRECN